MEGFFIPPGCTGLRVPLEDLLADVGDPAGYLVYRALLSNGIAGLYELAVREGFKAADFKSGKYVSKCAFCFYIRKYLSQKNYRELDEDFYIEALKYY